MSGDEAQKYPEAAPVVSHLLEIIDILEATSGPWVGTCECGWRSQDWDNEADARAETWAHAPCFLPKVQEARP